MCTTLKLHEKQTLAILIASFSVLYMSLKYKFRMAYIIYSSISELYSGFF
jgi:hypothetical protein